MSAAVQRWLEARWYGGITPAWYLRVVAMLFAALSGLRRQAYRRGWLASERLPVPVLVVGNIGIGGAGKTPLTLALAQALAKRGWRPGIVSRGYRRQGTGVLRVTADTAATEAGDEPALLARRSGLPLAVARRRGDAARLLLREADIDLVIADDGLQHYALQRDVEVAVVDARRGLGNGRLLPAGPLREAPARLAACDFRVGNGGAAAGVAIDAEMQLVSAHAVALLDGSVRSLASFAGMTVHALAGIADPERFFAALRGLGIGVLTHPFADHHRYSAADFSFDDGCPVLMTEKDAVKCEAFAARHWYAVPVDARLPLDFIAALEPHLRRAQERLHAR